MLLIKQLLIVCPLVFFAGFVDSIAGGGGIISLPAYIAAGLPAHFALGTNKMASVCGTSLSAYRFIKDGRIHIKAAAISAVMALIGSFLGARLALLLKPQFIQYLLVVLLPILTVFVLKSKRFKYETAENIRPLRQILILSAAAGFFIGGYDGFFGPGAGSFLILAFNIVIGLDILTSSGTAKAVNLASNLAALFVFFPNGNIVFQIAIPAAICSILGNYIGSGLALKRNVKIIKPVFILVLSFLLIKVVFDLRQSFV